MAAGLNTSAGTARWQHCRGRVARHTLLRCVSVFLSQVSSEGKHERPFFRGKTGPARGSVGKCQGKGTRSRLNAIEQADAAGESGLTGVADCWCDKLSACEMLDWVNSMSAHGHQRSPIGNAISTWSPPPMGLCESCAGGNREIFAAAGASGARVFTRQRLSEPVWFSAWEASRDRGASHDHRPGSA